MASPTTKFRALLALTGLLALSSCATGRESIQDCQQSAQAYCDRTVKAKGGGQAGPVTGGPAVRSAEYQQCLEPQLAACGAR